MRESSFLKLLPPQFKYSTNVDLSKRTWFGSGGKADVIFRPKNIAELMTFCNSFENKSVIHVLGACSNVLVRDSGINGIVIKLGKDFNYARKLSKDTFEVGAATLDMNVANFCAENEIGGLEFLVGIPGTIGGNLRMNAGCYGSAIGDVAVSLEAVDFFGNLHEFNMPIGFKYRHNPLPMDLIFTKVILRGYQEDSDKILEKMKMIKHKRESIQPIGLKTSGSTFVNPDTISETTLTKAWQLIDACGLRGIKVGGAQVSQKHCNFIINNDNASSADIEAVGELMRSSVKRVFNIDLQWEIERFGLF